MRIITVFALAIALPVAAQAQSHDWSGVYIGGQIGGASGSTDYVHYETAPPTQEGFSTDPSGFTWGGQVGLQKQFSHFVVGVEATYSALGITDSAGTTLGNFARTRSTELDDMWTVAGRLGYASGPWLGYVKAGYANAEVGFVNTRNDTGAVLGESHNREGGWLVGAGFEYAFARNLSLGLDYTYVDLNVGRQQQSLNGTPVNAFNDNIDANLHQVMVRLNYHLVDTHEFEPLK